ncbi:hypothetical protein ACP70R_000229 [Stipagrostis hirtigluma subsp. patula]
MCAWVSAIVPALLCFLTIFSASRHHGWRLILVEVLCSALASGFLGAAAVSLLNLSALFFRALKEFTSVTIIWIVFDPSKESLALH